MWERVFIIMSARLYVFIVCVCGCVFTETGDTHDQTRREHGMVNMHLPLLTPKGRI